MCTYAATRPDYVATCGMFVCCLETHEQRGRHGHAGTAAKNHRPGNSNDVIALSRQHTAEFGGTKK